MSKFAGLAAKVSAPTRVELVHPATDEPIKDAEGNPAYIEIYSTDSTVGREFDAGERRKVLDRAAKGKNVDLPDQLDQNVAKAAKLTKAWHLVDVDTGDVIDVPCTAENAAELYATPGLGWLFAQVWLAAASPANFMKGSPKA